MPIDPSLGFSLADIAAQAQDMQVQRQQMGQRDRALNQQDREFEMEMQRHTAGLAKEQREAAAAGLEDVAAAVQWAQTPEQWAVVQQHYGQYSPEIAAIPFEQREQALISVGKMADYLKNTEPKIITPQPGAGAFSYDRQRGLQTLIQPNEDGSHAMGEPVSGGPPVGSVHNGFRFKGGNPNDRNAWEPAGGTGSNAGGTFRPVGLPGERVTSTLRSPAHNRAVGGVSNSYHLTGRARDSVPPPGMSLSAYAAELRRRNPHLDVINEGDHVHMEPRG